MTALIVISILLIGLLVGTGIGKIKRTTPIVHNLEAAEIPRQAFTPLGSLELLGAIGIAVGLVLPPLAIISALCLVWYFTGAVAAHVRAGDRNVLPAGAAWAMSAAVFILHWRRMGRRSTPDRSPERGD